VNFDGFRVVRVKDLAGFVGRLLTRGNILLLFYSSPHQVHPSKLDCQKHVSGTLELLWTVKTLSSVYVLPFFSILELAMLYRK